MKKKTEKPTLDVETDHLPQTHLCWILSSIVFFFQPSISTEIDIFQEEEIKLNKILIFSKNLK